MPRCLLISVVLIVCGCGSGMQPVKGVLTLDGQPLAGAGIVFTPIDGKGRIAYAETSADGTFTLRTETPGDGVLAGEYAVTIVWEDPPHPYEAYRDGAPKKAELEAEYREWLRTKKKKPSPVPPEYAAPNTTPLQVKVPLTGNKLHIDLITPK